MNSFIIDKQLPTNSIESNKLLHICSQCTRTFKDINNFREHLFQEHGELGVNVRQCHLCSYATLLKSKYDCHIVKDRCHLNNRVLRCQKCSYSTINIRHMSKHERQHSVSNSTTITTNDHSNREVKRARYESSNPSPHTNWSTTLYINTQIKDESIKTNDEQQTGFSSCFLTDKLLMPDNKRSLLSQINKSDEIHNLRSLQSNSSYSTEESNCNPCTHQNHLIALRTNVWTLLRMLLPQLSFYYPSISMIDYESDSCIDRLVANLIQIPSFYNSYSSV